MIRNISIGRKLMLIIMSTCSIALFLACAAFSAYEFFTFRRGMARDLSALAEITGKNSTAALMFDDSASAGSTLSSLSVKKYIVDAYIYNVDGNVFTTYHRDDFTEDFLPVESGEYGSIFRKGYLEVSAPIIMDAEVVGAVYIRSELKGLYSRLKQYGTIAVIIMVTAITAAFLLSVRLQQSISRPVLTLVNWAKKVSEKKDYSVRVEEQKQEEFAILTKAFNEMLGQIHERDVILQKSYDNLELKVKERTMDLQVEIVQRKDVEEELVNYQKRLVAVLDTVGEGIVTIDSKGVVVMVNRELCNIFGFSQEEIIDKNIQILIPEKNRERYLEGLSQYAETGKPGFLGQRLELEGLKKVGSTFPLEICITETRIGDGLFFTVAACDITERKKAEENLVRLMSAIEHAGDAIVITNAEGIIQYVNPAFTQISGYTKEEATGRTPVMLKSGRQSVTFYKELWEKITQGEVWEGHFVNKKKNGQLYEEYATISSVRDASGKIVNYIAVKRDVTREVELEAQLRQALKMEAIGKLAGGIAHDFNNLLGGILGYANLLKVKAANDKDVFKVADTIEKASKRAAELTQQLLGFARMGKYENIVIDVHGIILEVTALAKRTFDKMVVISYEFRAKTATILGDPNQIHQVILNLSINARDAMPNGGNLIFVTEIILLDEEYCKIYPSSSPGKYLRISVTDTGHGIPDNIQDLIFEPFFTTKDVGEGTGMGLAMIYGIVKNHGGLVEVDSEVEKGTTFNLYLPIFVDTAEKEADNAEESLIKGKGRILLVDDEELIRNSVTDMLRYLEYDVVTAIDGQDAVEYYKKSGKDIDLVIMDLVMPRLGGYESFMAIKEINPDVKVILSTGYTRNEDTQKMLDAGVISFLPKPYKVNQFSKVVVEALEGGNQ